MAITTPRARMIAKLVSIGLGVLLAVAAVLGFSHAGFVAAAEPNVSNNWATDSAPTMTLNDVNEAIEAPLFSFVGLPKTGDHQLTETDGYLTTEGITRTIYIRYEGTRNAEVRMYVEPGFTGDASLAANTLVSVRRTVDGTTQTVFTDIPLSSLPTNWGNAGPVGNHWLVDRNDSPETATYEVTIRAATDPTTRASVGGVVFVWEAQER